MFFSGDTQKVLEDLERKRAKNWNISRFVAVFLYFELLKIKARKVLEIGASTGYSSIWFALAVREFGGRVISVESHQERFDEAQKNFQLAGVSQSIKLVRGHAPEVFESEREVLEGGFDCVFLDATKMEYLKYYQMTRNLIKPGGLLIADNVYSHGSSMQDFLDMIKKDADFQTRELDLGTGILLATKVS